MAGTTTYRFALHRKVPILVICNLRFGYQHVDIVESRYHFVSSKLRTERERCCHGVQTKMMVARATITLGEGIKSHVRFQSTKIATSSLHSHPLPFSVDHSTKTP